MLEFECRGADPIAMDILADDRQIPLFEFGVVRSILPSSLISTTGIGDSRCLLQYGRGAQAQAEIPRDDDISPRPGRDSTSRCDLQLFPLDTP